MPYVISSTNYDNVFIHRNAGINRTFSNLPSDISFGRDYFTPLLNEAKIFSSEEKAFKEIERFFKNSNIFGSSFEKLGLKPIEIIITIKNA